MHVPWKYMELRSEILGEVLIFWLDLVTLHSAILSKNHVKRAFQAGVYQNKAQNR